MPPGRPSQTRIPSRSEYDSSWGIIPSIVGAGLAVAPCEGVPCHAFLIGWCKWASGQGPRKYVPYRPVKFVPNIWFRTFRRCSHSEQCKKLFKSIISVICGRWVCGLYYSACHVCVTCRVKKIKAVCRRYLWRKLWKNQRLSCPMCQTGGQLVILCTVSSGTSLNWTIINYSRWIYIRAVTKMAWNIPSYLRMYRFFIRKFNFGIRWDKHITVWHTIFDYKIVSSIFMKQHSWWLTTSKESTLFCTLYRIIFQIFCRNQKKHKY